MSPEQIGRVSIIGGTGHLGLALARRLGRANVEVRIGSRDPQKARAAALAAGLDADRGCVNVEAAGIAEIAVITVPFEAQEATLLTLREHLNGKVVLETTVPYDRASRTIVLPAEISAAERAAQLLPSAAVVSGFHTVSSSMLADLTRPLHGDVLLCGDDARAKARAAALVQAIGMRPVDAGPLRSARVLEQFAGLLLQLNRRLRKHDLGIMIAGLD